jgi:neutral ceramidase
MNTLNRLAKVVVVLTMLTSFSGAGAAEPEWKVGLAQVKITPEHPVFLAGYANRNKPFTKVESDLYAKALALEDGEGQRAVLVTSDLIGFTAAVAEPICARLRDKVGLKREQILLNSSHTHTGPMLSLNPSDTEGPTGGDLQRTVEYTRQLQDKVVEVAQQALARLEPARLSGIHPQGRHPRRQSARPGRPHRPRPAHRNPERQTAGGPLRRRRPRYDADRQRLRVVR